MLIYLVRHGQTDWNAEGRLQGAQDVPLNDFGRRQARGNGEILAKLLGDGMGDFDYVASPLGRTRETMEIMRAEMGLDPKAYRTDDRLIEVSFGDWEGLTIPEIAATAPHLVAAREADKWNFLPPGAAAESYEILSWRVAAWLNDVERPTVCVCHGGIIRALFYLIAKMPGAEAGLAPAYQDRIVRIEGETIAWL